MTALPTKRVHRIGRISWWPIAYDRHNGSITFSRKGSMDPATDFLGRYFGPIPDKTGISINIFHRWAISVDLGDWLSVADR